MATYYGDVGIGVGLESDDCSDTSSNFKTQVFKMLFDTGSCEFWIPSDKCTTERCQSHDKYHKSCSFREFASAQMRIQ